jgi:hypothetical protein
MKSADYYRTLLLGVVIGMGFLSMLYVFLSPVENVKPVESKSNFEVVDTYKDRCDVVKYTVPIEAKYHYFLDCTDSMRNK